jgi:hypothetical protein
VKSALAAKRSASTPQSARLAREIGCGPSRAGDLFQIRDAFNDTMLYFIGENDSQNDGHARLARLSFCTLRSLARLPTGVARIRQPRQLSTADDLVTDRLRTAGERPATSDSAAARA